MRHLAALPRRLTAESHSAHRLTRNAPGARDEIISRSRSPGGASCARRSCKSLFAIRVERLRIVPGGTGASVRVSDPTRENLRSVDNILCTKYIPDAVKTS